MDFLSSNNLQPQSLHRSSYAKTDETQISKISPLPSRVPILQLLDYNPSGFLNYLIQVHEEVENLKRINGDLIQENLNLRDLFTSQYIRQYSRSTKSSPEKPAQSSKVKDLVIKYHGDPNQEKAIDHESSQGTSAASEICVGTPTFTLRIELVNVQTELEPPDAEGTRSRATLRIGMPEPSPRPKSKVTIMDQKPPEVVQARPSASPNIPNRGPAPGTLDQKPVRSLGFIPPRSILPGLGTQKSKSKIPAAGTLNSCPKPKPQPLRNELNVLHMAGRGIKPVKYPILSSMEIQQGNGESDEESSEDHESLQYRARPRDFVKNLTSTFEDPPAFLTRGSMTSSRSVPVEQLVQQIHVPPTPTQIPQQGVTPDTKGNKVSKKHMSPNGGKQSTGGVFGLFSKPTKIPGKIGEGQGHSPPVPITISIPKESSKRSKSKKPAPPPPPPKPPKKF